MSYVIPIKYLLIQLLWKFVYQFNSIEAELYQQYEVLFYVFYFLLVAAFY